MPKNELISRPAAAASTREWLDLSLAQQAVWLDAKLSGAADYQLAGWARIDCAIDEEILRQSLRLLMARHDALRLRVDDELPRQWMDESGHVPLTISEQSGPIESHIERSFAKPLPLGDHALFQVELVRAGAQVNYILCRFHHLIADFTSVSLVLRLWAEAYEALSGSDTAELTAGSSYRNVIEADAAYRESAGYQHDLAYWTSRFEPLPPPLISDLEARPAAHLSVPVAEWRFEGDAFSGFQQRAHQAGATAQRALSALFAVTVGRRYGQSDVVTGVALHRRDHTNRSAIGMLAGVLPLRCQFEPYWTLAECVQAFSEQMDADLRHQRMPVDVLSRTLGLAGTGRAGLFEAVVSFIPAARGQQAAEGRGLPITTGATPSREASPISLHITKLASSNGLALKMAVNPDYLGEGEAATLLELLRAAIEQFAGDADTRAEDLDRATEAERRLILAEWNATSAEFPQDTLDAMFAASARRHPDAMAVEGPDGRCLTYRELDEASDRVARALVSRHIAPGDVVGVRMMRSADTIIALLAILKAGGVYLPLDPSYPHERLEFMISDSGAVLVLDSLPAFEVSDARLPTLGDPGRVAYVIYTSGTTGQPKGVAVSHAAAVNLAFARRACHDPIGPGDRILAAISVSFDVSIGQLLLPLLSGAAIVVAGDLKSMNAAGFWSMLARRGVTHINSVPSFIDSVLDAAPAAGVLQLKRLMMGGEALSGALVARIHRLLPGVDAVNMYGPTEACIDATYHRATAQDENTPVLAIGRPLSNYRAYVLDEYLDPAGIGVSGELYLGGAGLAEGYLHAPGLTSERFVADPFSAAPGARLYRTGDRARWNASGELEFLGRTDQQIKIRGFRVEPAEIAAQLLDHPRVSQAVVVPRSGPGGQPRLVAYVVPDADAPEPGDLRQHLARRLPDYMVPSAFVAIDEIPLTANGKLDTRALPLPDPAEDVYVAPRTATEEVVAELFAEVLGVPRCGAQSNFFELGGHSLLATSLVSRLLHLGVAMPLRAVFENPTVEALAKRIDATLPAYEQTQSIGAGPRPADVPLSFPQERIWFASQLEADSSYNIPIALELLGRLDREALAKAIGTIVERHEALRTAMVPRSTGPCQVVMPAGAFQFETVDLASREAELPVHLAALARHAFDLAAGKPLELKLFQLEADRHVLAAVIHHVAFDGWSAGIFLKELSALYSAYAAGNPNPLAGSPLAYADYALWQRRQDHSTDLAFWLEELRHAPARSELPGRALPAGSVVRAARTLPLDLDPLLCAALRKLAHENSASLFMVLHAAFAVTLAHWCGQPEVVIGTVTANRRRRELEDVIGCFVNTLALRTRIEHGESFRQLLSRVRAFDVAAFSHQDLPFEQLVEALAPERSLQQTPIFQTMLVLQNTPELAVRLPELEARPLPVAIPAAQFDFTLTFVEENGGLAGSMEFAANRFDEDAILRFGQHLSRVLESVAADPEQDATAVSPLSAADRQLVLEDWNRTQVDYPTGTLDSLFAEQVRRTPSAVAVVGTDGHELTYAELDAAATRLARYLISRGVGEQQVIGVRMERSAETIISMLAILKAGAIYLPLDPAYPPERLEYMIADSGASLVLDSIAGLESDVTLREPAGPDRLAYIIYTSGSTGRPKGVAVPHAAAVNLVHARSDCYDPLGPGDRVLALTSVSFDMSIEQLLLPLMRGATVVVAGDVKTMGAAGFWDLAAGRQVTHIDFVPSFIDSILDAAPAPAGLSLRRLMLGGEAVPGPLLGRIHRKLPGLEVVNVYGPTETCIDATCYRARPGDESETVLPIGRPLNNYRAYILDAAMRPVGIGAPGELWIGGAGLARGYVNAPELTAERFVAGPFATEPGARLYRTGDLTRWRPDGCIEFLGRIDQQVKIRGFRVELEEIEACIRRCKGVREAVVIAREAGAQMQLIGYYTGDALAVEDLRVEMAASLPYYMVPSAFLRLDKLPLLENGKLDRRALPAPDDSAFAGRPYEAPAGEIEETIATVWRDLLKLERVGRHDNFFELGGHSLLAVSLIERLHERSITLDLRALFTSPTVAQLAATVPASNPLADVHPLPRPTSEQLDAIAAAVPGGPGNLQDVYPLAPLQEGILFQHLMTPEGDPYVTPVLMAFQSRERLNEFLRALNRVIERHDVLRTGMVWKGVDEPMQFVLRSACAPVEEVTPGEETDVAAELLRRFDPSTYRMNIAEAPLLRVVIAEDRPRRRWLLLLLTHHLVIDHTGMETVVDELRAFMHDPGAKLPAAIPYRNFVAESRAGVSRESHQEFFTRLLASVDEPTAPFGLLDIQSRDTQWKAGGEGRLAIDDDLGRRIREQARRLGITPASLFHAAWAAVLAHVCSKRDVVFGTVLFGRMHGGEGAGRVAGMFINTLPVRAEVDNTGVEASVLATHRLLAELIVHEHAPLSLAQRCSSVAAPAPLFSALFNFRYSPPAGAAPWPGVEILYASERTNYPLAMAVDDTGGAFSLTALTQKTIDPDRVCRYLHCAAAGLVDALEHEPQKPFDSIEVVPAEEQNLLTQRWNATAASFPQGTLDGLFAEQAARTPDAKAVIGTDGREMTYAGLDAASSRLACSLVKRGVNPGDVVGVRMERSAELVIAALAILKAGGTYLPLDPSYPSDRLTYMASDAGARLILESADCDDADSVQPAAPADPSRIAYIIYTSGTTGQPKGVAVPHSAPVNLAFARRACHDPIGRGDRILAAISIGFDVSIGQLLLPLLSGATVVIAPELKTLGAVAFWDLLASRRITHINSVPSFLDSILDSAPAAGLNLKRLMLGGEVLSGALVERIWSKLPRVELVNMYGPTEACIDATWYTARRDDVALAGLPIGRPLSNYSVYVLDHRMRPAGIGVAGDLYIGGMGLAAGYVNAPDLTRERFVADPFSGVPGARLYRSGDRARWSAQGQLEFLGRADHQVKIRGFRVEPEEIEAQLRRLPTVKEAAVIAEHGAGGTRLIAYYTGAESASLEQLRAGIAAALPAYMVPAAFVRLDRLPLSTNGKLDRKALPKPGAAAFVSRPFEPPAGEVEEKIAAAWKSLLKVDRVGRHDSFFELGGHSLLAVSLMERLERQGLSLDVRTLFTNPTVAALAAAGAAPAPVTQVSLVPAGISAIAQATPGGAANLQDVYPLAPLQEGILFQSLLAGDNDPYLVPFLLSFVNRERLDSFVHALDRLVARHDALRTGLVWSGVEEPLQYVVREAAVPVEEATLEAGGDAVSRLLERYRRGDFRLDLSQAPLLRVAVAHDAANNRWLLLLVTHHLIVDHTSMAIMVGELRMLMEGREAELPRALPYRDFVAQTRSAVSREEHESFFTQLLAGVEEPTAPYGIVETQADSSETLEGILRLGRPLSDRIRDAARVRGVTAASLFHLAWAAVLSHICGKPDVVFGTVLLGRMRSGQAEGNAVGMFINTLPIRITLSSAGIEDSAKRTQHLLAELLKHEHAPLSLAQRASALPPSAPLFSSLFNYRYSPGEDAPWPGVEMLYGAERTNYPLAMAVDDLGSEFQLTALTQPGIDPRRMCAYLEHAAASMVDLLERAPHTPVSKLPVLPPAERRQVTEVWNRTDAPFPQGTLDSLFVAEARRHPDAIAIIDRDGQQITYSELDARSTALARYLVSRGVGPERVAGVRMERSAATIIAFLGILKAGGTYLPLDPAYPAERLAFLAKDAGALLVLDTIAGLESDAPLPQLPGDADRAAYIIYTSGTTGQPKGVVVPHSAAVNLAFARGACHDPIGPGDRILAAIAVGFDVSIGQLLLPLLSGATVVVAGDVSAMAGAEFWAFLAERRITHINSVPSFIDSIIDAAPPAGRLALKRLMLGGEPLTGALIAKIHRLLPGVEAVNMYGPTEACIDATYHVATAGDIAAAVLPIGRPLSNYRAYVLDAAAEPVGVGVAGELYLGGAGLARGYLKAPELTAARFVPDPFSAAPGAKLYRTGDRARWRPDGSLEFLGRGDHQVKIRGFRVEPGEIAAVLLQHPSIAQAVVVPQGQARLAAYYVARPGETPDAAELRTYLAARLPAYMLPAAFAAIPAVPLTANGKLDIAALPSAMPRAAGRHESARNAMERALQQDFERILGISPVGIEDNFFELGGDSLSALRLMNAVNSRLNSNLPMRTLFAQPTVEAMARAIDANGAGSTASLVIPLQPRGAKPNLFCIHPAGGYVFCYLPLVRELGPDQPVFGIQASGLEQGEPLAESIEAMASDYVSAIRRLQPAGPYQLLGMSSGGLIAFAMAHRLKDQGQEVSLLCMLDSTVPDTVDEASFTSEMLVRAIAGEIGCADLVPCGEEPTLAALLAKAHAAGRLPADFTLSNAGRLAEVFRNTVRNYARYQPGVWPGRALLIRALRRPDGGAPPDWSRLVSGELLVADLDCAHEELVSQALAAQVAEVIRKAHA